MAHLTCKKPKSDGKEVGTYTSAISAHHIRRQPTAMLRGTGTRTIPNTKHLPYPPRKRRDNLIRTINRRLLTRAHRRDLGRRVPTKPGRRGAAALHLRRARAQITRRSARTVGRPAAVTGRGGAAFGLGAAADAGWVAGAGAGDGGAAGGGAGCVGEADAGDVVGAVAGFVDGGEGEGGEEGEDGG